MEQFRFDPTKPITDTEVKAAHEAYGRSPVTDITKSMVIEYTNIYTNMFEKQFRAKVAGCSELVLPVAEPATDGSYAGYVAMLKAKRVHT